METRKTIRAVLLGAVLLTGCQVKIDGGLLPTTPSPRPTSDMPTPTPVDIGSCTRTSPAVTPTSGQSKHGAYNAQRLPNGWDASMANEAAVTLAIAKLDGTGDWACFNKFYPGAATVYQALKGSVTLPRPRVTPTPRPVPTPSPVPTVIATSQPAILPAWFVPPPCRPSAQSQLSLSGTVFDEQGVPFPDGVEVRVSTRGFAFNTTVQVSDGRYWVYGAPAGEKLEITAVHQASGEARRRFVTPAGSFNDCGPQGFAVVNFGGPKSPDDALGHRYPLPTVDSTYKQERAVVSGQVYDIGGNPMEDVTVTLTSLLADVPYKATVQTAGGAYVVNEVPTGVPIEIRVEHPSYHARARADVFFAGDAGRKGNVVNFGGDPSIEDPYAPQYGLAPLPPDTITGPVPVKGLVENIDGKPVTAGVVYARSQEPGVPFEAKAAIGPDGAYHFDSVPGGIEIEFTLEAPGYEPMVRYERLGLERGAYVHFGGGSEQEDPEGESYALVELVVWGED